MIRKIFTKRFLSLLAGGVLAAAGTHAQTTTLTTTSPSTQYNIVTGSGYASDFITFDIENTNKCPVALSSLSMVHFGAANINFPPVKTVSANDTVYELYTNSVLLSGAPSPFTPANNWVKVATSPKINTGATNAVTPIFTNLNVVVPPAGKLRFLVRVLDSMIIPLNTGPATITNNGITLTCAGANIYSGYFNLPLSFNGSGINPPQATINFEGVLVFKDLPPSPPVITTVPFPAKGCVGASMTLKAKYAQGGTYTWKDPKGNVVLTDTIGTLVINALDTQHNGIYSVTVTQCGKTSDPATVNVEVRNPNPPSIDGKVDYCLNEPFIPVTVNGTNPKWYYEPTGGSPVPITPTLNTSSPNVLIYYVSQTDQYGCESKERTMVRFRAAPKPPKPIATTPIYYCEEDESEQLNAIGDTLKWYYFPTGGIPTTIAPTPNTSVRDSFQYFVTQTVNGCESDRKRVDVVVTFRPNGKILVSREAICAEDTVTIGYYGSAYDGSQYNWSFPEKGTTILNGGFDQGPIIIRLDSAGRQNIKLRVGQVGCLSEQYIEDVIVSPLPYGAISTKQDVCLGQPELIESLHFTPGLDTFYWNFAGGKTTHFTTDQGPYGVYWETPGEKIISVVFEENACRDTTYDTIMVHPKPSAKIIGTQDVFVDGSYKTLPFNAGDSLCASDSLKVTVERVEPGATYKWTPNRFFDTYSDQPVTYARVDFKSNIYVEVEDIYGCRNKDSMAVLTKSCCMMTFPTAFTPNGDGRNDLFRPITVGRREVKTFKVVNRYGQTVFEGKDPSAGWGWNGMMNGKPADVGTYFYLISFKCENEDVDQAGEVILMR